MSINMEPSAEVVARTSIYPYILPLDLNFTFKVNFSNNSLMMTTGFIVSISYPLSGSHTYSIVTLSRTFVSNDVTSKNIIVSPLVFMFLILLTNWYYASLGDCRVVLK